MNEERQKKAQKIAALLATSVDQAGTPEGRLAAQRASELMEKHGLTMNDVQDKELERIELECQRSNLKRGIWGAASIVAGVFVTYNDRKLAIYGEPHRIELAKYLFEALNNQCEAALRQSPEWQMGSDRGSRTRIRWNWRMSFVVALTQKCLDAVRNDAHISQALMPISAREKAERWAIQEHSLSIASPGKLRYRPSESGHAAGRNANLNRPVSAGQGQRALGSGS